MSYCRDLWKVRTSIPWVILIFLALSAYWLLWGLHRILGQQRRQRKINADLRAPQISAINTESITAGLWRIRVGMSVWFVSATILTESQTHLQIRFLQNVKIKVFPIVKRNRQTGKYRLRYQSSEWISPLLGWIRRQSVGVVSGVSGQFSKKFSQELT